ncbi:BQ5605_C027g10404 [Microbotryum silenes-dioicae]|uniref:pectinesterase n=1 Tax=Microbotryum silenes-dioicae TaxID=796604 RepID=A0A2X0PMI6_9BASI|nr:BQ5605_C027g10404 [Microbotryum silenes-dioicae]
MVQVHHRPTGIQRLFCWVLVLQLASLSAFAALDTAKREACQVFTNSPDLSKCPVETIYVSARDPKAKFKSIQQAINYLKATTANTPATILIGSGLYQEQLVGQIPSLRSSYASNTVDINHNRVLQKSDGYQNWLTSTLLVDGCADFKAYNLNLSQTAPVGIALAVAVMSSSGSFYACAIEGHQDTLFLGPNKTHGYLYGCYVSGVVDFIYGWGSLVVKDSQIMLLGEGTAYVAWRGAETTTSGAAVGRAWNDKARIVILDCYLGSMILPGFFAPWTYNPEDTRLSEEVFFGEYNSHGPGSKAKSKIVDNRTGIVNVDHLLHVLDQKSAAPYYLLSTIFPNDTSWIDPNFNVKAVSLASGGVGGSSTPGALAAAPALAASFPPPAGKASPALSAGKDTPLTKQDPKKPTQDPKKPTQDPKKPTQDPKKPTQDPKKTEHNPTKQKSKHHSHPKRKKKATSTKPQVDSGAGAGSSHVSGGGPNLASLPKQRGHGSGGHPHHHNHHHHHHG